jgi:hypothetical protein
MANTPVICGLLSEKKRPMVTYGCREGYKIFSFDWKSHCDNYHGDNYHGDNYDLNKVNIHSGEIKLGVSGLHFCVNAIDCLAYNPIEPNSLFATKYLKYAKVRTTESSLVISDHVNCVTDQLEITEELSSTQFFNLCTGKFVGVYANGNKRADCDYMNGQMHGQYQFWSIKGQLLIKIDCVTGQISGQAIEWNHYGKKIYHCEFHNGKEHGLYRDWWQNGESRLTCNFLAGTLNGDWKICYPNGQVEEERHYTMGIY